MGIWHVVSFGQNRTYRPISLMIYSSSRYCWYFFPGWKHFCCADQRLLMVIEPLPVWMSTFARGRLPISLLPTLLSIEPLNVCRSKLSEELAGNVKMTEPLPVSMRKVPFGSSEPSKVISPLPVLRRELLLKLTCEAVIEPLPVFEFICPLIPSIRMSP